MTRSWRRPGTEFLLKIVPRVDGTPRICELVEYN
jgi:acetoacetate decarboxylase